MVVWQFATIAALIVALLIHVMLLTNRLGVTNALLKRIEEGLVRSLPVTENLPAREAQGAPDRASPPMQRTAVEQGALEQAAVEAPVPAAVPVAAVAEMEVPGAAAAEALEMDRRVSYLTVRDLKVIARSGRRSSDTQVGASPLFNEVFGKRHARAELAEVCGEAGSRLEAGAVEEPVVASVETSEVIEELAAATGEMRDFLEAAPPMPPVEAPEPQPVALEPAALERALARTAAFEQMSAEPAALERALARTAAFEQVPAEPAALERAPAGTPAFEQVPAEPPTLERALARTPAFEQVPAEYTAFERLPTDYTPFERVSAESVAFESATTAPAFVLAEPLPVPEPAIAEASAMVLPAAANEGKASVAATEKSQADEAAAREEKKKRDLLMHAYRRRRHR